MPTLPVMLNPDEKEKIGFVVIVVAFFILIGVVFSGIKV